MKLTAGDKINQMTGEKRILSIQLPEYAIFLRSYQNMQFHLLLCVRDENIRIEISQKRAMKSWCQNDRIFKLLKKKLDF